MQFEGFPKMARFSRDFIITEKIDGTNAQIFINDIHLEPTYTSIMYEQSGLYVADLNIISVIDGFTIRAGSRNKWITPGKSNDNMGFAGWVKDNAEELIKLGEGRHFGEWWGKGIQRGYGVPDKRFSLFNCFRWTIEERPQCCDVVPILTAGNFDKINVNVENAIKNLREQGSKAAPGFMDPEGVVVWHVAGKIGFKKTIKNDDSPKSLI